ncbi:ABC transporter permease subunit [Ruegeria sp. 2012CJ41-6]|uniref:ABC transporter permease subunit n=1 Tax=Ruegeria spongiae TaxID=2942209 RepID=A0ABT0Q734_9RHOB|nr:ABC transporter permease subunit [Ruegeria spongiae]MCL6285683.1 ABC transporter permease subunit [Ruegeria spongiae]
MQEIINWSDEFLAGAMVIIQLFFVSLLMVIVWGLLGATAKLSNSRIARGIANGFTVLCRGIPEFLLLLIVYFGSAVTLTNIARSWDPEIRFMDIPPFWAGAFAISLVIGAYATETFRGAFLGIDKGLVEAAKALGLTRFQVFWRLRLPMMWRLALPGFGNHLLSLLKDTALVSVIGVQGILFTAQQATTVNHKPFTMYLTVAFIFLALSTVIVVTMKCIEKYAYRHLEAAR